MIKVKWLMFFLLGMIIAVVLVEQYSTSAAHDYADKYCQSTGWETMRRMDKQLFHMIPDKVQCANWYSEDTNTEPEHYYT